MRETSGMNQPKMYRSSARKEPLMYMRSARQLTVSGFSSSFALAILRFTSTASASTAAHRAMLTQETLVPAARSPVPSQDGYRATKSCSTCR